MKHTNAIYLSALLASICLAIAACSNDRHRLRYPDNQTNGTTAHPFHAPNHSLTTRLDTESVRIDACRIVDSLDNYANIIERNSKSFLQGNDSCVLAVIDKLIHQYSMDPQRFRLAVLDSICRYSDGYISDQLANESSKLFFAQPGLTIAYLESSSNQFNQSLRQFIIDSWSSQISETPDTLSAKRALQHKIDEALRSANLNEKSKAYVMNMFRSVRGGYWD